MSLLAELKRRNVIRMAGLYLVGAWLLVQVASTLFPAFGVPGWALRALVIVLALGFSPALVFAWVFELTPDGIKRDAEVGPGQSIAPQTAQRMNRLIIAVLMLALVYFGFDKMMLAPKREQALVAADAPASAAPVSAALVASDGLRSIAVLPFVDMSQSKDQEYFSDGLSEQLLNDLAQIPELHVAGRTSSFYFKGRNVDLREIGSKLNVATVLEGSVARSGNKLRVTAQLINAKDGYHLWSHTYDREFDDVFAMQDEIAGNVVSALKLKLLPGHAAPTRQRVAPAAYNQYLLGLSFSRQQNLVGWAKAAEAFRKALALAPDYAAAYAALAEVTLSRSYDNRSADKVLAAQQEASRLVDKAVELGPGLADTYRVRSQIRSQGRFDIVGGMADAEHAVALSPTDSEVLAQAGRLLVVLRRFDQAQARLDQALAIDPLSTDALLSMAELSRARGDDAKAREYYGRILEISPDSSYAGSGIVQSWLKAGNTEKARAVDVGKPGPARLLYSQALLQHSLGNRREADAALDELIRTFSAGWAYQIGVTYAWRGENDKALAWLERAYEQHDGGLLRLDTEPMLAGLRKDTRYARLRRKVGFPE